MPSAYPDQEALQVTLLSSKLSVHNWEEINDTLIETAESSVGEEAVIQVYFAAQQYLKEHHKSESEPLQPAEPVYEMEETIVIDQPIMPILGRRAIYFHHIIAASKRKVVMEWAVHLGLGGFSKIGWPGVVIVEGPEACVKEYVRRLQHLRWKQMIVRGEQIEEGVLGQTVDDLRKIPPAFREFPTDGMSDIARACRECGLEELFLTTMKIYNRSEKGKKNCVNRRFRLVFGFVLGASLGVAGGAVVVSVAWRGGFPNDSFCGWQVLLPTKDDDGATF